MKKRMFYLLIISAVLVGCKQEPPFCLGKGYVFSTESSGYLSVVDSSNTAAIMPHIIAAGFDSTFVIAKQKPLYELWDEATKRGIERSDKVDAFFRESTLYYYWIIDKRNDSIYGPLTKEKYRIKRIKLNVNRKLGLRRVYNNLYDNNGAFYFDDGRDGFYGPILE